MTTYRVKASTDLGRWGVPIVREGEAGGDCFETCNGRHSGDQLVAVVVNGDQALAERICALLNAGETGGPRSVLGDLIVMHGPFDQPLRFGGFGDDDELTDWLELNALRDELIALRDIATGGGA